MKVLNKVVSFSLIVTLLIGSMFVAQSIGAKTVKKKGKYFVELKTKANKKYKLDTYAKKITFKKNKLIVNGKIVFNIKKELKLAKRTFKISKKCKFYKGAYVVSEEKWKLTEISKKKLAKKATKLTKGKDASKGRILYWTVKNGKIVKLVYGYNEYKSINFDGEQETDENGEPL